MRELLPLIAIASIAAPARADDAQYVPYPIGARAVGLGGAYTALSDDPSGLYYNPAGLVDSARTSLQVSTNLYGLDLDVGKGIFSTVGQTEVFSLDKVITELQIIPTTAGFVVGFGERNVDGGFRHAYALGAFVPSIRTVNFQTSVSDEGTQNAYRRNVSDRTLAASAAYAYRADEVWSVGIAGTVGYRTLHDQEETSLRLERAGGPDFFTAATSLDLAVAMLSVTFGIKGLVTDDWTIGLSVTTPTSRVFDRADVRVNRSSAQGGSAIYDLRDESGIRADTRVGAVLRAGVAKSFKDWKLLTFDLSFYAPTRYKLLDIPPEKRAVEEALTLVNDVDRSWVVNIAAGYETPLGGDTTFSMGLYTNLPSSRPIEASVYDRDQLPHVTSVGGAFSFGILGEHTATNVGLTGSFGWGRDVIARNETLRALEQGGFRTVEVRQLRVFLHLSSTFMY